MHAAPPPPIPHHPLPGATPGAQQIARIVLAVLLLGLGLFILEGFLRALIWAGILTIATWPLYMRARARMPHGKHDILLPLLFTGGSTLIVLVPLILLAVRAGGEARSVATWLAEARHNGIPLPDALTHLPAFQSQIATWWDANLANPEGARALLGRLDTEMMQFGRSYGSRLLHSGVVFGFTIMTLFFLYKDGPALSAQLLDVSRRLFGPHGERVARQMVASIHGTVDGLVLVGIGVGIALGIGYAIAGAPHPILLGAVTAVGAMVPMGAWILLAIACLLVLAAGKALAAAILAAFGVVVIFGADHFIRPALIGGATRLPFLWVLLGILGGVETMGLLGLFVGPAVMSALILLWREWVGDAKTPRE